MRTCAACCDACGTPFDSTQHTGFGATTRTVKRAPGAHSQIIFYAGMGQFAPCIVFMGDNLHRRGTIL